MTENEIYVRRMQIDDALFKLDHFLNNSFMKGDREFRIVHGKGTGKLRQAIHDYLSKHPLVKSYRLGGWGEGDYGVTVVRLAESWE